MEQEIFYEVDSEDNDNIRPYIICPFCKEKAYMQGTHEYGLFFRCEWCHFEQNVEQNS